MCLGLIFISCLLRVLGSRVSGLIFIPCLPCVLGSRVSGADIYIMFTLCSRLACVWG